MRGVHKEDIVLKTRSLSAAALLIFCAACSRSSSSSPTGALGALSVGPSEIVLPLNFSTHMQGHHEVPARETNAQGQLMLKISNDRQSIEYKLIASNIDNVVASHIHQGEVGVGGPAVVFLYGNAAPGGGRHNGVLSTGTLTAASLVGPLTGRPFSELIDLIESGNAYANVHTNDGIGAANTGPGDFQAGEIRGQLRK
jgi:hypothetical protein